MKSSFGTLAVLVVDPHIGYSCCCSVVAGMMIAQKLNRVQSNLLNIAVDTSAENVLSIHAMTKFEKQDP